jgi:hypothetical protein
LRRLLGKFKLGWRHGAAGFFEGGLTPLCPPLR